MSVEVSGEVTDALETARELARLGIPIFVAPPNPDKKIGFDLPTDWEQTTPDPSVVDRWQPGWALCAVMGCGLDLIDIDTRNGGDVATLNGSLPRAHAVAATPSGGGHLFIASTGSGSRDGVYPGVDVKSGMADGTGRGFAFLAPTVKPSKVDGVPRAYRWYARPDIEALSAVLADPGADTSGEALAARVRALKADRGVARLGGPDWWRQFALSKESQSMAAAERAIAMKLAEVRDHTQAGGENFRTTLMRAAMTLGGYVGSGYLGEADAVGRLEEATAAVWGTPDEDDRLWIQQGLADGAVRPFFVHTPEQEQGYSEADEAPRAAWNIYTALGNEPFDPTEDQTDQGMAEAVAARMYPALRFAADTGSWLVRGEKVWREREDMSGWAISTVARLMPMGQTPVPKELTERTPEHWQAERRARFMDSGRSGKIERKLRSIVRNPDHPGAVELAHLDADPEILWAGGRAWDLRASIEVPTPAELDPATPHLHTAAVAPMIVDTPAWDRFVAAVWPDPELRAWALRVLAISLTGYPDAALPMLYGPERTGKTAIVQLIVRVLGSYGHAADPRLLAAADNSHASVVYALKGRRLSFIDEGPRRGHLATERLKQLTGGGSLTGNAMRANPITFEPTHTLVMTTNDEPPITDPALRARARIIPCEGEQADVRAARQAITPLVWRREAPGVLALLMREAAAYLADLDSAGSDRAPGSIRAAVEEMVASQNPTREWVTNATVPADPGTPGRDLYRRFVDWFEAQSIYRRQNPPTETMFGRTLTEMGYPGTKIGRDRERKLYRPLSVFNHGGGRAPWEPSWPASEGTVRGESGDGAGPEPSPAQNPSSDPVFSSFGEGGEGTSSTTNSTTHTTTTNGVSPTKFPVNRDETSDPPQISGKTSADLMVPGSEATVPPQVESHLGLSAPSPNSAPESPVPFSSQIVAKLTGTTPRPTEPTNAEVAARAFQGGDEKKITKAEARRQLKEEARLAAVAEASGGESLELPVAVNRAGALIPMSIEDAAATVRALIARDGALTVDVETTGYPIGHQHYELRTVQLGVHDAAVVFDPIEHAEEVRALLAEASKLHAHSAPADLVPLEHAGLLARGAEESWRRMHDTALPSRLVDPSAETGLKELAAQRLGEHAVSPAAEEGRKAVFKVARWLEQTSADTPIERSGWAQIDRCSPTMLRYAAADVLDTAALALTLPTIPDRVMDRERLAQRMTARVTHRGVALDYAHVQEMTAQHSAARAEVGARVREQLRIDDPGSNAKIAKALLEMGAPLPLSLKTRNPSAAKEELQKLAIRADVSQEIKDAAKAVLEFRHHSTVLGLFLDPYRVLCERGDGRARPTIYTLGTDTGRMSATRPNVQQLSRSGGVRACMIADPGQLMIGADFSSVEIRVAAALSQDPDLMALIAAEDSFRNEVATRARCDGTSEKAARAAILAERGWAHAGEADGLHWMIARQIWGEEATKGDRYVAKRIVFGRIYGGGVPTLSAQVGVSESIGQAVVDMLDHLTPRLSAWSNEVRQAVRQGYVQFPSYSGRIIHFDRAYPHKAPNFMIQGSARELLIDALERWADTRWGRATLLPVHDELDAFVPAEEAADATKALVECMTSELNGVKIVAEASEPSPFWVDSE